MNEMSPRHASWHSFWNLLLRTVLAAIQMPAGPAAVRGPLHAPAQASLGFREKVVRRAGFMTDAIVIPAPPSLLPRAL